MITEFSKAVCVPELMILSRHRGTISDIREVYWLLLFENGFNYCEIGRLCERTHAAVLSGIKRVKGLLEKGDEKITKLYELTKNIKR